MYELKFGVIPFYFRHTSRFRFILLLSLGCGHLITLQFVETCNFRPVSLHFVSTRVGLTLFVIMVFHVVHTVVVEASPIGVVHVFFVQVGRRVVFVYISVSLLGM